MWRQRGVERGCECGDRGEWREDVSVETEGSGERM